MSYVPYCMFITVRYLLFHFHCSTQLPSIAPTMMYSVQQYTGTLRVNVGIARHSNSNQDAGDRHFLQPIKVSNIYSRIYLQFI